MRINGFEVDGFGVWSGLRLSDLSDQLNVFYGPNEAGKTTLMQFVRSILYGFSPERRSRYLPPVRDGRPGGSLEAAAGSDTFVISRYADGPDGAGHAHLADRNGFPLEDHRLQELLGDVDEAVFNNVFAFGLREIQELGSLSDTEAAHQLYDLTLGLDRVSLFEVLRELESSRNRLLAADQRPSLIVQLIADRERLRSEIQPLRQSTTRYLESIRRRDLLHSQIGQQEAEGARHDERVRLVEMAQSLADRWQSRIQAERQLAALGSANPLPEAALERLEKLNQRFVVRRKRRRMIQRSLQKRRAEMAALPVNEALARNAPRVEALGEQQQWIGSLAHQIGQLEEEIAELELGREADQQQWGKLDKKFEQAGPLSGQKLASLRAAGKSLVAARRNVRDVMGQIRDSAASKTAASDRLRSSLANRPEQDLVQALGKAGDLVSRLRHRVQIDERLDQMSHQQADLEDDEHELLDRQLLSPGLLLGLLSVFGVGALLILLYFAGLTGLATVATGIGWPIAAAGTAFVVVAGALKFHLERSAGQQLDNCQKQHEMLCEQIDQAQKERDALDKELPRGGGPLVARLQAAEKELASLEALSPLEADRANAHREVQTAQDRKRDAAAEFKKAQSRWRQELTAAGFPADLRPKQLREFQERQEQVRLLTRRLDERRGELTDRRGEYDGVVNRIRQLAGDPPAPAASDAVAKAAAEPLAQLRRLLAELAEQQSRVVQRDQILRRIEHLRHRELRCRHALDRVRQRRRILMLEAGVANEEEFRRRSAAQAEVQRLRLAHAALVQEIAAAVSGRYPEETIGQLLADPRGLAALEQEARAHVQASKEQLARLYETRGQLNEQLQTLAEDRRLPQKQLELGIVEQRLAESIDRWRTLAVCERVLESVRASYERERQPEALREASKYLQRLTGGRYTRVWTPLGQHVLRVDDAEGHALPVEVLSRGTREQLFLSLRLALVTAYAARGVRLPLVLDDVLVNFDAGRAKAAAGVLRDFSKNGFQLLVFTCHEHIARLFKAVRAEVRQLPDNARPGRAEVMDAEPVKKPRRPRPEPEVEEDEPEVAAMPEPAAVRELVVVREPLIVPEPVVVPQPIFEFAGETNVAASQVVVEVVSAPVLPVVVELPRIPAAIVEKAPVPERIEPQRVLPRPHARFSLPPRPRPVARRVSIDTIERVPWNAEEFDGELADRVRRTHEEVEIRPADEALQRLPARDSEAEQDTEQAADEVDYIWPGH